MAVVALVGPAAATGIAGGDRVVVVVVDDRVGQRWRVAGFEPGPDRDGEVGAVEPGDLGAADGADQAGLDLGEDAVEDPGSAGHSAAGAPGVLGDGVLADDDGDERFGADGRAVDRGVELGVDARRDLGLGGAGVLADPLGAFGAVVGDGAHADGDQVDLAARGGCLEELGESGAHPVAVVVVGHADAGVDDARGGCPGPGGVVLDDRRAYGAPGHRRAVVDLDAGQHAGQVRLASGRRSRRPLPWTGSGSSRRRVRRGVG